MRRSLLPPSRIGRPGVRIAGCAALLLALALAGCDWSAETVAPAAPTASLGLAPGDDLVDANPHGTFYPLEIGNSWHFDRRDVFEFFPAGSDVSTGTEVFHFEEDHVLDQTEVLFGRTYIVESRTIVQDFPDNETLYEWIRYRQDRSGLYEADVSINDPPGNPVKATSAQSQGTERRRVSDLRAFGPLAVEHAASMRSAIEELDRRRLRVRGALRGERVSGPPGGVLPDELTRLSYPLHPHASWPVREGLLDAHVEGLEQLVTPAGKFPAWRIRLVWGTPGFDDTILMWFGRCGTLKLYFLGETVAVGPGGDVLGTLRLESVEIVEDLDVQGRPCGTRPDRPTLSD